MPPSVVIVVAAGVFAAAGEIAGPGADDSAVLQGTWTCVTATIDGKPLDAKVAAKLRLVMTADRYRTERGDEVLFDSTYRLDAAHDPKYIEMTGTEGEAAGTPALGIYSLEGDTLKICYTMPGGHRPTTFESAPGSKAFLVTWQREREQPPR